MSKPKKPLPWSFMKYLQFGTKTKPKGKKSQGRADEGHPPPAL